MTVIDYYREESEDSFGPNAITWQDVVTRVIAPDVAGEHIIWFYCEYAGVNVGEDVAVRITVDGTERGFDHFSPSTSNYFRGWSPMRLVNLSVQPYTFKLQVVCADAAQTVKIRRKRLLLMKH